MSAPIRTEILALPKAKPSQRFLVAADAIGCRIVRDAIWSGRRCNWLIWTKEPIGAAMQSVYRAAPNDLYLGTAGIALFLAYLARATGDAAQREAVIGAVYQIQARLEQRQAQGFGFYSGSSGAAWALAAIGAIWGDDAWTRSGLTALDAIGRDADTRGLDDVIVGKAGLLLALTSAAVRFETPALLDHATRIGEDLVASAQRFGDACAWPAPPGVPQPLLGFSHGTAGNALALLELHRLTGDARLRDTALAALRHERRAFDHKRRNWPDYRTMPGSASAAPTFPVAWCHGSTGIGFSRLRLLELAPDDAAALGELDIALANATAALNMPMAPFTSDFTLCHGVSGNNDFMLAIGERFARPEAFAAAERVGNVMLDLIHDNRLGWGCGIPDCGDSPSLLTGSAGVGLHLLRLHARDAVPSILYPQLAPHRGAIPPQRRASATPAKIKETLP